MKKTQLYTIIVFSFCSALLDFLITNNTDTIFPRNRIIHIIISVIIALIGICVTKYLTFDNKIIKYTASFIISVRIIYVFYRFIEFYKIFHSTNSIAVLLFSVILILMFKSYVCDKTQLLYSFWGLINVSMMALIILLCIDKINAVNIYSVDSAFNFDIKYIFAFFDIFTIALLVKDKEKRTYTQIRYLTATAVFMILTTLLQGLCVGGNILYRLSPLQSLLQIFYTDTIKRFDYIFAIYYLLAYFAAIMLYVWSIKNLISDRKEMKDENT